MPAPLSLSADGPVVVVFAERRAAAGLRDRFLRPKMIRGDGFESYRGRLAGLEGDREVVAVVPHGDAEIAYGRLMNAVRLAYRPSLVVGAGFACAVSGEVAPWAPLLAISAQQREKTSVRLFGLALPEQVVAGAFQQVTHEDRAVGADVVATNGWCYDLALACDGEALMLAVNEPCEQSSSADVANVERRSTVAGKAGALARLLWTRPSGVRTLWRRQEAIWESQERLADAVVDAINRSDALITGRA